MKLNVKAFGLSFGIIWGALVFIASLSVYFREGTGELTGKLARFYFGYNPIQIHGAIVGLIYGFISAFIFGALFAVIYNAICRKTKAPLSE